MHRSLVATTLLLASGGWVCDGSEPCSQGDLICSSDVADDVCCPPGSPYRCDGQCSATPQCSDYLVCKYPDDPGTGLCTAGAYVATIQGVACNEPATMTVSGTLVGCGPIAVIIGEQSYSADGSCGSWRMLPPLVGCPGVVCLPPGGTEPVETSWQVTSYFDGAPIGPETLSVTLEVGGEPVVAEHTFTCASSP
jgi:hypothetical protein